MESIPDINGQPVHFEKNTVDVPESGKDANTIYFLINSMESEGVGWLDDGIYLGDTQAAVGPFNFNLKINNLINMMYPIGKVEIFYDNEDHSSYMGFHWQRCLVGRVPVGIDSSDTDFDTIGKFTGEKTHTLTVEEMPSHTHEVENGGSLVGGSHYPATSAGRSDDTHSTLPTGGGQPHNNIQPSEVVAFWKRIE